MQIVWWYWICLGFLLLLAEMISAGGFYLFFFGIAAVIVGIVAIGVSVIWIQITLFALISIILIATLRKPLVDQVRKTTRQADTPEFIGETARTVEPIAPDREGKIELRGSVWLARNTGTAEIPQNGLCTIIAREGLMMIVTIKQ